ncbi:MAG: MBL fold metallo-hydrolase [Gemmatimonadota bacterium]|jgi:ribonuclease BN (tRNA processing enzyme)
MLPAPVRERMLRLVLLFFVAGMLPGAAGCQAAAVPEPRTRVVLLGTGTPNADPDRQGPATAVLVDDRAYLVDAGTGIVRRAAEAARDLGIGALLASRLDRVFITHLHSDHTIGLPDLLLSPWVLERVPPLEVWGPPGTDRMMRLIGEAWSEDVDIRLNGLEPRDSNPDGYRSVVHEVTPGLVYQDDRVKVYAFQVKHGSWQYAYAYRFEGPDRTIVISGDTSPTDAIVEACGGCDVLVHEVYSADRFAGRPSEWQRYHSAFHTSTAELAGLAQRAQPKLLVLYHQLFWDTNGAGLVREIRAAGYDGPVRSGRDLDVF